jgi:hypothetical protein
VQNKHRHLVVAATGTGKPLSIHASYTFEQSSTGQRYLRHEAMGYTPLLFVRETKNLPSGLSAPYHFFGPCQYISHTGSRPISITWRQKYPIPAGLYRAMARQIAV